MVEKAVVFEKSSDRVGLVIGQGEDSEKAGSNKSTRVLVLWKTDAEAVPVQLGRDVIGGTFPSLLLLKHSSKEFLESLWVADPGSVVRLALEAFPEKTAAAPGIVKELSKAPNSIETKAENVEKILKDLVLKKLVSLDPHRKGWHTLSSTPEGTWPERLQWLWDYESGAPKKQVRDVSAAPRSPSSPSKKGEKKTPSPKTELTKKHSTKITPAAAELAPAAFFVAELSGESAQEPAGYSNWLSSNWEAAGKIDQIAAIKGLLSLKKAKRSHWPVIALTTRSSWLAEDALIYSKIFSSAIIPQIARTSGLKWEAKPWIKVELIKTKSIDFGGCKPLQILRADENIEALTGPGIAVLAQLREHIMKSTKFKTDYLEARKHNQSTADQLLAATVARTAWGSGRLNLALRAVKALKIEPTAIPIFQDASVEDVETTLRSDLVSSPAHAQWLRDVASERINQVLPNLIGLDASLRIISMVSEFGLLLDPKILGQTFRKAMVGDPNAKYLVNEVFNEAVVHDHAERLQIAETGMSRLDSALKALQATALKEKAELKRLQDKLLQSRSDEEHELSKDAMFAKLPILKALARAMAAAHELLEHNPQAVARFEIIGDQVGLQTIGAPGSSVLFDPINYDSPAGGIATGESVTVQNVGYKWQDGESELVLLKALVI